MKSSFRLFAIIVVLGLCFLPFQSSSAAWHLNDGADEIIRDDGELGHELDKGRYKYWDNQTQQWVIIMDFSISSKPLVNREVVWVEFQLN